MSIISREAGSKYPAGTPGMDPAPLRAAYMAGASREPTDVEVEAGAERLFYTECVRTGLVFSPGWDGLPEDSKDDYRRLVRKILAAIYAKATQEEETE